jgi:DNA-directed RNA polymerase specialized sigma subunit
MNHNEMTKILKDLKYKNIQLERYQAKIDRLRNSTLYPSTTNLEAEGSNETITNTIPNKLNKVADMEIEYKKIFINNEKDILFLEKKLLELGKIQEKYAIILAMYYIDGLNIQDIVYKLNYEIATIKRYKREAINKLIDIW